MSHKPKIQNRPSWLGFKYGPPSESARRCSLDTPTIALDDWKGNCQEPWAMPKPYRSVPRTVGSWACPPRGLPSR